MSELTGDEPMLRVAVVEDYLALAEEVQEYLIGEGFDTRAVDSAESLNQLLRNWSAEIIVLDVGLPDEDGFSIATRLRRMMPNLGIILLSARITSRDRVEGYNAGADVYLTKPTRMEELAAVIRNLAARLQPGRRGTEASPQWTLHLIQQHLLTPGGQKLELTAAECSVLYALLMAPGQCVESWRLMEMTAEQNLVDGGSKNQLEAIISRLRRKLRPYVGDENPLRAQRGQGYRLCFTCRLANG